MIIFYLFFMFILINFLEVATNNLTDSGHNYDYVPRVVNGWPGKLGDVPYQIAFKSLVKRSRIYVTFCGGVIIAPAKLLTAAHCFTRSKSFWQKLCGMASTSKKSLSNTYAVAGNLWNRGYYSEFDSLDSGQWRVMQKVVFPNTYKFPKDDIAIGFTMKPFIYNAHVNVIPFASKYIDYTGQCLVSGFGRISKQATSDKLLLAHLTLIPRRRCNSIHRRNMRKFVCTSSKVTDVGKGDSGGPLVCSNTGDPNEKGAKGILVGIVSGHRHNAGAFFTRVSSYYKYIERNKCSIQKLDIVLIFFITTIQTNLLF